MRSRALLFLLMLLPLGVAGRAAAQPSPSVDSLFAAPNLDLAALEAGVLARNPSLAAMRAAWQAMEARAGQVGGWDDPRLDAMVAPQSLSSSQVDPAYSFQISQVVPLFGQRSLMGRATRSMAQAMHEDYRAMRLQMLGMARELYFQLYLSARGIEVNRELADLLDQFHRVALQKYAAGTAGQQDALQADVELAMLEHQLVALGRTRQETQARLRALLHDETDRPFPDPPRDLPHIEHQLADTTVAAALVNRPELRSREATIQARRLEISAASRMRLPELMLQARYDRFMDMPEWRKMVGAGITLPIWIGKNNAGVRAARSELQRAQDEQLAIADSIRAQVEAARARVRETTHELDIIETRVVPVSERALASVRVGYESNRSDFLALLTAERDLARARFDRYQSIAMVHMALADLERAIGIEPAALRGEESR
ncbi:MAG: TolC family protein [Bacteroidota bacterium]